MKIFAILILTSMISGCAVVDTVKKYWPRSHDPVMFDHLVAIDIAIDHVNCDKPDWSKVLRRSQQLARYTAWRSDPQSENIKGLAAHAERMNKGGSKTFCELGKKTGKGRIDAAKSAWEGR